MDRDIAARRHGLRPISLGVLLLATGLGLGDSAFAIGIGRPATQSSLGHPLNLVFPVRLAAGESLSAECVRAEVQAGDAHLPPSVLQLQLEGENETRVQAVRLRSAVQIDEPIVSIQLSIGCPARLTRQFTAFIDPPTGNEPLPAQAAVPEPATRGYSPALRAALATSEARPDALLGRTESLPSGQPALVAPPPAAPASRPAQGAAPKLAMATDAQGLAAPKPKPPRKKARGPSATVGSKAEPLTASADKAGAPAKGPSLHMDPPEILQSAASAASPAPQPNLELEAALARLQKLEEKLGQVESGNRATESQLLTLRAQLDQARQDRYQNPLVWGLLAAVLGLGGACAYLWRSRRSERELRDSAWWAQVQSEQRMERESRFSGLSSMTEPVPSAPMPIAAGGTRAPVPAAAPLSSEEFHANTMSGALIEADHPPAGAPVSLSGSLALEPVEPLSVQLVEPGSGASLVPAVAGGHAVTVEELIDLEQQVDFFQVLGQDDAAIELLSARIATGMASALPYLKLLEIHQRHGDVAAFAALGQRFAERFGALPPTMGSDLNSGRHLEAYEAVMHRVQQVWRDAGASMALLQQLLSRGSESESADERGGGVQTHGFDLPAYRDLLMLYGVARDLSEHEVRGEEIDLFLPLEPMAGGAGGTGMMATMVWQRPGSSVHGPLDVDISLDEPEEPDTTRR